MIILVKLILAHLLGDFVLQPNTWVKNKADKKIKSIELYFHTLIHGILILLLLGSLNFWKPALILSLSHGIIDLLKVYFSKSKNKTTWFFIDQLLHFIAIFIIWYFFFNPEVSPFDIWNNPSLWIYTTAIIFLSIVSGIIMQQILRNWNKQIQEVNKLSLKNAGKYIGYLERLFVFLFVVSNHWGAIGFLLTAKSVFRFGDLKESTNRKLTEYILIGTLLSFGLAILTGLVVLKVLNLKN